VRALVAEEPRRDAATLMVQELDDARALDIWMSELLDVLETRGWSVTAHALDAGEQMRPKERRWGLPRDAAYLRQFLRGDRKAASLLVSITGQDAVLTMFEAGMQRFVTDKTAQLWVQGIAARASFTDDDWKKLQPEPPAALPERARLKPSRIHDRTRGKLTLAGIGDLEIASAWRAFDEVALALLLASEKGTLPVDRDDVFRGRLGEGNEIRAVLQTQGKIAAIKLYRELTGVGLREAKDAVEAIEALAKEEDE
jgi:hypothetical protein